MKKNFILTTLFTFIITFINTKISFAIPQEAEKALAEFISEFNIHIKGIIAIGVLTSLFSFIYNFVKLGIYATNPQQRATAIRNLIISGICTAIFGSLGIFVFLFYTIVF